MNNLIISRSGNNSLHNNWLNGKYQNFDLIITYFNEDEPSTIKEIKDSKKIVGPKWGGLFDYISKNKSILDQYDYFCFPDDDLSFDSDTISNYFDILKILDADLAQPSLDKESFFSYPITLHHPCFARKTNYVELMIPTFSRKFLKEVYKQWEGVNTGWGMDCDWYYQLKSLNFNDPYIIDAIQVTHTRPVGLANSGSATGSSPWDEFKAFKKNKGVAHYKVKNFSFLNKDLEEIPKMTVFLQLSDKWILKKRLGKVNKLDNNAFGKLINSLNILSIIPTYIKGLINVLKSIYLDFKT